MNNKKRAELTSRGIKSNIPKVSFVKSLYEYIWNGFDAGASIVEIIIERNKLNAPEVIIVKDNGNGIDSNTLNKTFSAFSDSPKVDKEKNLLVTN